MLASCDAAWPFVDHTDTVFLQYKLTALHGLSSSESRATLSFPVLERPEPSYLKSLSKGVMLPWQVLLQTLGKE